MGVSPGNEGVDKLMDGDMHTKWLDFSFPAHDPKLSVACIELDTPSVIAKVSLTTANDSPDRDPQSWIIRGSNTGCGQEDEHQGGKILMTATEFALSDKRFETSTISFN